MKDNYKNRFQVIQVVFVVAAIVLLVKAFQIQIIDQSHKKRAQAIAVGTEVQYPSRGLIFDRNKKLLVNNNPIYDLMVTYKQLDPQMDTAYLCQLLDIPVESFIQRLDKKFTGRNAKFAKHKPFVFMSKLSSEVYARFQENLYRFPGFKVRLRNVRGYPHKNAAHLLGYLNEVSQDQINKSNGKYKLTDYIGATGIEKKYEEELRGRKGVKHIFRDNLGRKVSAYQEGQHDSSAVSGQNLITAIDLDLQAYGEELMKNKTGSIVAIEPSTGEILSLVSAPTFDPNLLSINRYRGNAFKELLMDTISRPFLDRSVMVNYPPGSIFKTVVGLVALQEGFLRPSKGYSCPGGYFVPGTEIKRGCHNHEYARNISTALQHSCNTYFFHVVREILELKDYYHPEPGLDLFGKYLYQFGLGKPLGSDLPNESSGNVPTVEYYDHLYRNLGGWKSPTIMSIGIGQGEIEMTTLQMANLAAIMANKGYFYTPHIIKGLDEVGKGIPQKYLVKNKVGVDEKHFDPIIKGMRKVVTKGTGYTAAVNGIPIAGKTGTSQNPHGKDHSVFFAFAPIDNPKIAIAVYVEHGEWGTNYAAPIAGLMIEKYLKKEISENRLVWEERMKNAVLIQKP